MSLSWWIRVAPMARRWWHGNSVRGVVVMEKGRHVDWKNRARQEASHDWVFSIDADEALSPALREEVRLVKESEPGDAAGFSMPRYMFYEGQWIRHGDWYPDRLVRLFLRDRARFVGGRVHETAGSRRPGSSAQWGLGTLFIPGR